MWVEFGPVAISFILWFTHASLLFYALWEDLTLAPMLMLLARPSAPWGGGGWLHLAYVACTGLFYLAQLPFLLNQGMVAPLVSGLRVENCSWVHTQFVEQLLGMRELEADARHYAIPAVCTALLVSLTTLKKRKAVHTLPLFKAFSVEALNTVAVFVSVLALVVAGCVWPSGLHAPYLLVAIVCSFGWASDASWMTKRCLVIMLRCVAVYVVLHLLLIVAYHNLYLYTHLSCHTNLTNVLGLKKMRDWMCEEPCSRQEDTSHLAVLLSLLCVWVATSQCTARLRDSLQSRLPGIYRDLAQEEVPVAEDSSTELQDLLFGTVMNSTMMVWSVMFHSWLGFFMLMMANVMWLIPRQSVLMKRMVRFVSVYACTLVLVTYATSFTYYYPEHVSGLHLRQFGFRFEQEKQVLLLLVQCLFTAVCLVTFRQYTKPYIAGLNIPLSGFKRWVKVITLMWVRLALLVIVIMILYDVQVFKIVAVPFYISIALAMWIPHRPGVPLTLFFFLLVSVAEIKLILTYLYNFKGAAEFVGRLLDLSAVRIYFTFGLRKMQGGALLLHLWLPNILAMFSAIFLTALKHQMVENLQKNWELWQLKMTELILVSCIQRDDAAAEEEKVKRE
ncbi:Hypothetical predicted protein [Cloeon dipterum]|uniref:Piezo TM1-24 domain-containing protein n=1 Tax=Cloeon dipterum TaxID=197152 RepID=A0A8S1DCA0_9INSE|nr:Hypothetical predicted protein [Cloeon dipterum]